MKFMYSIGYKKPNDVTTFLGWYGGNTPEEATASAIKTAVEFHNKWNKNKLTEADLKVTECKLSGDYASVLADLQRG